MVTIYVLNGRICTFYERIRKHSLFKACNNMHINAEEIVQFIAQTHKK